MAARDSAHVRDARDGITSADDSHSDSSRHWTRRSDTRHETGSTQLEYGSTRHTIRGITRTRHGSAQDHSTGTQSQRRSAVSRAQSQHTARRSRAGQYAGSRSQHAGQHTAAGGRHTARRGRSRRSARTIRITLRLRYDHARHSTWHTAAARGTQPTRIAATHGTRQHKRQTRARFAQGKGKTFRVKTKKDWGPLDFDFISLLGVVGKNRAVIKNLYISNKKFFTH